MLLPTQKLASGKKIVTESIFAIGIGTHHTCTVNNFSFILNCDTAEWSILVIPIIIFVYPQ